MASESSLKEFEVQALIDLYKISKVFQPQQKLEHTLETPMVYDDTVVLSENELIVLSNNPKFAVRQQFSKETLKIEIEKMIYKQWSSGFAAWSKCGNPVWLFKKIFKEWEINTLKLFNQL